MSEAVTYSNTLFKIKRLLGNTKVFLEPQDLFSDA